MREPTILRETVYPKPAIQESSGAIAPGVPVIFSPVDGSDMPSPLFSVSGSVENAYAVKIFVDGTLVGTTYDIVHDFFSFDIPESAGLLDGESYIITAKGVNQNGDSAFSNEIAVSINASSTNILTTMSGEPIMTIDEAILLYL